MCCVMGDAACVPWRAVAGAIAALAVRRHTSWRARRDAAVDAGQAVVARAGTVRLAVAIAAALVGADVMATIVAAIARLAVAFTALALALLVAAARARELGAVVATIARRAVTLAVEAVAVWSDAMRGARQLRTVEGEGNG